KPRELTQPVWTRLIWNRPWLPPPGLTAAGLRPDSQRATSTACACCSGVAPFSLNATQIICSGVQALSARTRAARAMSPRARDDIFMWVLLLSRDPRPAGRRSVEGPRTRSRRADDPRRGAARTTRTAPGGLWAQDVGHCARPEESAAQI